MKLSPKRHTSFPTNSLCIIDRQMLFICFSFFHSPPSPPIALILLHGQSLDPITIPAIYSISAPQSCGCRYAIAIIGNHLQLKLQYDVNFKLVLVLVLMLSLLFFVPSLFWSCSFVLPRRWRRLMIHIQQ